MGAGVVLAYGGLRAYRAAGPLAQPAVVVVPRGSSASETARILVDTGVVRDGLVWRVLAGLTAWQGPIRAAEYQIPAGASAEQVLLILRSGRAVQHLLTVPEGVTAARVAEIMAAASGLTGEIRLADEGAFLPESYAYERGAAGDAVVRRGQAALRQALERAWASRGASVRLADARDLLILASMVERETRLPGERRMVAAVFLNRLRLGMKLQSDPTVVYGVSGGVGELAHGLRRDELTWATPYNTYVVGGLPAGPICNPGVGSIEAAAHPAVTDALYFVADGSGGHVFARTLGEHVLNVARLRRLGR